MYKCSTLDNVSNSGVGAGAGPSDREQSEEQKTQEAPASCRPKEVRHKMMRADHFETQPSVRISNGKGSLELAVGMLMMDGVRVVSIEW